MVRMKKGVVMITTILLLLALIAAPFAMAATIWVSGGFYGNEYFRYISFSNAGPSWPSVTIDGHKYSVEPFGDWYMEFSTYARREITVSGHGYLSYW